VIEGLTLSFAVGLFAVVCPCAIALAVALAGLPLRSTAEEGRHPAAGALRAAAVMGVCFVAVYAIGSLMIAAGIERAFDVIPWLAALAGVGIAALGLRGALTRARPYPISAVNAGVVYAIVSIPCMLTVFRALVDQGTEAAGPAAVVGVAIAFGAGCAAALAVPVVAGALAHRAGGLVARAAALLAAAAGAGLTIYWLPSLFGGRIERGGAADGAANDLSAAITEALARYELVFALVLLAMAGLALVVALRPRPR
jgi:hypothetical protein